MTIRIMTALSAAILLSACTGNSSTTRTIETEEITDVSGRVGAAIVRGRVSATPINLEGGPSLVTNDNGDVVFDGEAAQSDRFGDYRLVLDNLTVGTTRVFIATDDNGVVGYRCEDPSGCRSLAFGSYVNIPDGLDIRAGVGEISDGMQVNINWVTDLAASLARTVYIDAIQNVDGVALRDDISEAVDTAKTGAYNEYSIELSNRHVSEMFGVSDVIAVTPISPSQITTSVDLTSAQLQASIYYGALVAALPELAENSDQEYMAMLTEITGDLIDNQGQLLQKGTPSTGVSLAQMYDAAVYLLSANIDRFQAAGAQVPPEATAALVQLRARSLALVEDERTNVDVDVPESLANWQSNIDAAKEFITDLTVAIDNFWAENPDESSFVDPDHARRMNTYYDVHETLFSDVSEELVGSNGVLPRLLDAADLLIECENAPDTCVTSSGDVVVDKTARSVTIDSSLTLLLQPQGAEDASTFEQFDFVIDKTLNSLDQNGRTYSWKEDTISDGTVIQQPFLRLYYEQEYAAIPRRNEVEPGQIAVVWPLVEFSGVLSDVGEDSGNHDISILFEANLIGVENPYATSQLRYNPVTIVLWLRSVASETDTRSAIISQIRTTGSAFYYPESKWPAASQFFKEPSDSVTAIPGMVASLYRGKETLSSGEVVDIFDQELDYVDAISRIRLFPYDSRTNTTESQSCAVTKNAVIEEREVIGDCSEPLSLAGEVTLDELLEDNFESGVLTHYEVPSNGTYIIDLSEDGRDILNPDGSYNGMTSGTLYGPFTGQFESAIKLGIDRLDVTMTSDMIVDENPVPVLLEFTLQRSVEDIYSAAVGYAFAPDAGLEQVSEVVGVALGAESQGFVFEYKVTEEQLSSGETIEVELGSMNISRSGVNLGGREQSVLTNIVSRSEYLQGDAETACGLNDRDKLSSNGDCDAVAYLTFRGALLATIREERPDVFVARFVDGSWMVLGGS